MALFRDKKEVFRWLVTLSALVVVYFVFFYENWLPVVNKQFRRQVVNEAFNSEDTKYILYWTTMLGNKNFHFSKSGRDLFAKCEYKNCYVTHDRNFLQSVDQYDALIFYIPKKVDAKDEGLPAKRSRHQRYIFAANETPVRFFGRTVQYTYNNFFNWTMSYRFDSDIIRRHGYVEEKVTKYVMPTRDELKNKTKMIAWMVSNCNSANRREELVKRIQKYIPVDIYGRCGNFSCPKDQDCLGMVEKKYKFYLSLENSHCKDYATEKLYKMLQRNVIPIVYGSGQYDELAPPHSVIDVEKFNSIKELTDYLKFLAENEEQYLEYFRWKKDYIISTSNSRTVCTLCEMLHNPNQPEKTYPDINYWWFGKNNSGCKVGNELPKIVL